MLENPEKFKDLLAGEAAAAEEKKEEEPLSPAADKKPEATEAKPVEVDGSVAGDIASGRGSALESEKPKQKRPTIDKQTAYLEFKSTQGKKIEENIIFSRQEMKEKRGQTKELTMKINVIKS